MRLEKKIKDQLISKTSVSLAEPDSNGCRRTHSANALHSLDSFSFLWLIFLLLLYFCRNGGRTCSGCIASEFSCMAIDLTLDDEPVRRPRAPPPAFIDLTDDAPPPPVKRKRQDVQINDDDDSPAAGGAGAGAGRAAEVDALRSRASSAEAQVTRLQAELKSARTESKGTISRLEDKVKSLKAEKAALESQLRLDCFICMDGYADGAPPHSTLCGHHAHKSCLDSWFKAGTAEARHHCPKCMTGLPGLLKYFRVYLR